MVRANQGVALLQQEERSAQDDDVDDDDNDNGSDDGANEENASQNDDKESKALSALEVTTDQKGAQQQPSPPPPKKAMPTPPVPKEKVVKRLDITVGGVKCPTEPPDCGLLHDNMSLMWGKFKDLVDELQAEMDKNLFEFTMLKADLNSQLDILRNSKARFTLELSEATASLNADREEMAEKEEQRKTLEHEYKVFMSHCKPQRGPGGDGREGGGAKD